MNAQGLPQGIFPATFEGSYLGDRARLAPTARLECKVCWHVYDPAEGCETWQIPAGTPFTALPDHWRCPVCDGARDQFMVLDGGAAGVAAVTAAPTPEEAHLDRLLAEVPQKLESTFREIHAGKMKGVPFVNGALSVKALGFRAFEGRGIGVLVTPWFMNIILLPGLQDDWAGLPTGTRELVDFPSGTYEFLSATRPETGPYKSCSLFSPMFDFTSMLQAVETAQAVIPALFDPANREEGARTGEIRRKAEDRARAEAAAEEEAREEAQTSAAPRATDGLPPMSQTPATFSRRSLILGPDGAPKAPATRPEGTS